MGRVLCVLIGPDGPDAGKIGGSVFLSFQGASEQPDWAAMFASWQGLGLIKV